MWDFSYAIPSLLMLAVFFGYYFALPRIPIWINRLFLSLLVTESLVLILDIGSSLADMNYQLLPLGFLYFINILYFLFFIIRAHLFFLYTINIFKHEAYRLKSGFVTFLPCSISIVIACLSPVLHTIFSIAESGFKRGPWYNIIYVEYLIYIFWDYVVAYKYRNLIRLKSELICVYWYNTLLLIGLFFRFFFPKYLIMDTFCILAITAIYLTFGNPEFYLENRSKVYNSKALREYLSEYSGLKKYKILTFVIRNYKDVRQIYGGDQMDRGICAIGSYLQNYYKKYLVFYYRSGRFVLLGDEKMNLDKTRKELSERFRYSWKTNESDMLLDISFATINPGNRKITADDALNTIAYALDGIGHTDSERYIEVGEEVFLKIQNQTEIKKSLEYSIDHNLVEVYLQPIMDSKTRKPVGAEALARIRDSEGKIISPALFIPIAEKNGRIIQLGEQVFVKTCDFIRNSSFEKLGINWVNVNLSPVQFIRTDLVERLNSIVIKKGVTPDKIHLEITEETMVDDKLFLKQVYAMENSGFSLVLDDYGKGYSNMTRLKNCPFINIKMDMGVVQEHCSDPNPMLPGVIATFKKMGFEITAEGIEDDNMADELTRLGADYLQGYLFSKPLPVEDFMKKYS